MKKKEEQTTDQEEVLEEKETEEENAVDKEVESLRHTVSEIDNNYKRALADYQNLQRRVQEEKIHWIQSANKDLLLKLLPVLDTLMLAQKHINDKGLELSIQQFLDVLEKEGVKKIKTNGGIFNPNEMECVETVEGEEGKVTEEIRPGYMLYDKVIRPAQVKVERKSV